MPRPAQIEIRSVAAVSPEALRALVVDTWHDESVVAHGERLYPARLPGYVALVSDAIVGHVSYRVAGDDCELTSIDAEPPRAGIGSALLEAAIAAARAAGCARVWLTTTNDNLDALRFYQRRGFRLTALRPGAVDLARSTLKPQLPIEGSYGIPMRDELDLVRDLDEPG